VRARYRSAIAAAILLSILAQSSIATIAAQQSPPWGFSTGWTFTWTYSVPPDHLFAGPNPREIQLLITAITPTGVTAINPTGTGWTITGNSSWYVDLGYGTQSWYSFEYNFSVATYSFTSGYYYLGSGALENDFLSIPVHASNPVALFDTAFQSIYNDSAWNITINETSLSYLAINKTNTLNRVAITFDSSTGMLKSITKTAPNGTVVDAMALTSVNNPAMDFSNAINVLTATGLSALVLIVVLVLMRRRKVRVEDIVGRKSRDAICGHCNAVIHNYTDGMICPYCGFKIPAISRNVEPAPKDKDLDDDYYLPG
jgi:hypothetical protein